LTTTEPAVRSAVVRERSYTWDDPMGIAAAAREVDGLMFVRRMASGEVSAPPIASTLGFTVEEVEQGRVVFGFEPAEYHFNPIGSVHGGVFATLLDSAAGCAVHSSLPAGVRYTSLDLSVKFLRPLLADTGRVRCEGLVVHLGGRTALAEARLFDGAGRLAAHATSSCLIIRPGR
jgi:uncharacterized protein (TIGR00369 family)